VDDAMIGTVAGSIGVTTLSAYAPDAAPDKPLFQAVHGRMERPAGKRCPSLDVAYFCSNIHNDKLQADAVLSTVPSREPPAAYAITGAITKKSGDAFHKQLPDKLTEG
jgi:hypothetical protein